MNIFKLYRDKIIDIIKLANIDSLIKLPENLNSINVDIPPSKFNCDISSNVAMILSKPNEKSPIEIAEILSKLFKEKDQYIGEITIENPGFIKLSEVLEGGNIMVSLAESSLGWVLAKDLKNSIFNKIRAIKKISLK